MPIRKADHGRLKNASTAKKEEKQKKPATTKAEYVDKPKKMKSRHSKVVLNIAQKTLPCLKD